MAGRRLVFSNPEIIRILKENFITYAGDQWYLNRQEDADGAFFWKVMDQGHLKSAPRNSTRQGVYACTSDGRHLGSRGFHPYPERTLELLRSALQQWNAGPKHAVLSESPARPDARYDRKPPEGGLILNVFTRIPIPQEPGKWTPNNATGRDHMWITRDEMKLLIPQSWRKGASVAIPKAVAERLVRYHLVDNVRGEPNHWDQAEVTESSLKLEVENPGTHTLRLSGTARMKTADGRRGYDTRVQGHLTCNPAMDRFSRFDVISWGEAWGSGTYTEGAPPGRFPLVIALSLAGNKSADMVAPQASRWLPGYLTPGR